MGSMVRSVDENEAKLKLLLEVGTIQFVLCCTGFNSLVLPRFLLLAGNGKLGRA